MEKLKQLIKEHSFKVLIILLLTNTFASLWLPAKDLTSYMYKKDVSSMIQHVIAQSIKESIEDAKVDYSLQLMLAETKNIRTTKEVDAKITFWKDNNWNAQLVALKIVLNSEYATEQLRKMMYNEQVYKALISHR